MNNLRYFVSSATILLASVLSFALTPQETVSQLKARIAPDKRTAIFNVNVSNTEISGTVGLQEQYDVLVAELNKANIKLPVNVTVLENQVPENKKWALITNSVATMRSTGKHSAEIETQGIMGQPVKVLETGEWCHVRCADDYITWVPSSSLSFRSNEGLQQWKQARRYVVTVYSTRLTTTPGGDETVTDLVLSNILEYKGISENEWLLLSTPDGRQGYINRNEVEELSQWAQQEFDPLLLETTARRMMGSTYLWGGTSSKMTDCSGLMKVCYLANAIILQRDASQQALTGTKLDIAQWQKAQKGDLVFFGNEKTGKVTHVGMYLQDGKVIHCSGRVKINSLNPADSDYLNGYGFLSISRINGMIGTKGIVALRNHPWFF